MSAKPSHAIVGIRKLVMGVAAGLCLAGAAAAMPADNVRVQAVSTAGLDLSSPHGRAALDRRIRDAARTVCDIGFFGSADRWLRIAERQCYDDAIAHARPQATVSAER